jgi:hypothetical protein
MEVSIKSQADDRLDKTFPTSRTQVPHLTCTYSRYNNSSSKIRLRCSRTIKWPVLFSNTRLKCPFTDREVKASMATRSLRGMASQVHIKAATVPMRPSSSLPGTDPTSRFSSNYYGPTPKELQAATRQPSKLNIKQRRHRSEFHTGTGLSTLRCPTPSTTP